ncbi:MAG TPA: glycosyltransferase family 9 protein [Sediminibacterium sp.]|nr:glycosyltransferase family 9 protein [Sediminibacterium sp.]
MLNRLKGILYDGALLLAKTGSRSLPARRLLIVRTDEIGDYMLWRKFLPLIAAHYRAEGYAVHFLGNSSWKSIYELLDHTVADQTIWMNKTTFKKNLNYRYRLLKLIYGYSYETVINPIFSRDKRNDDAIVRAAQARYRIGMRANPEAVKPYELGYDKGLYTTLFDYPQKPVFEFYRNRLFTEFITGQPAAVENTSIQPELLPALPDGLPEQYFVVFPGSRSSARIWAIEHFITVSNYLFETYGLTTVLCGGPGDKPYTIAFETAYGHPLVNLSGKTSLPQLLSVLSAAKCLISVDTGSVHLAAAVGCTVFGVFNGSQYKRFAPYPPEVHDRFFAVYPEAVEQELKATEPVPPKYEFTVNISYNQVQPEQLIQLIQTHL